MMRHSPYRCVSLLRNDNLNRKGAMGAKVGEEISDLKSRIQILCAFLCVLCAFAVQLPAGAADVLINGKTFHLPDGFTMELVAGPPLVERPIMADFDEQGRL